MENVDNKLQKKSNMSLHKENVHETANSFALHQFEKETTTSFTHLWLIFKRCHKCSSDVYSRSRLRVHKVYIHETLLLVTDLMLNACLVVGIINLKN